MVSIPPIDLTRERLVVVVTQHATLRRARRAPGVDEGCEVARSHVHVRCPRVGLLNRFPRVARHPGDVPSADHDDVGEVGNEVDDLRRPIEQRLGDDDDGRTRIGQLVAKVLQSEVRKSVTNLAALR